MNKRSARLTYSSSLSSLSEINTSFDTGVLRIAYVGKNRNGSYISKDTFEKCIKTMYNCPIVCNYDRDTDSIGGHDVEIVTDTEGNLKLVNSTIPVGVIPESSNYFWEMVEEEDGVSHEYLCADVLIWKRQEAYQKIKRDGVTKHSMELSIKDGQLNDGVFEIYDFEFTAFCLLGDAHEPCFESSSMGVFSLDSLKNQMEEMMSELKTTYSLVSPLTEVEDISNNPTEGGEKVLNEKFALAAEYGYEIEALDFSVEEMSVEELREKFEAMRESSNEVHPDAPEEEPVEEPVAEEASVEETFELNSQIFDEIRYAVEAEMIKRPWGEMPRYSIVDFDAETMSVYCFDADDHWKLYGFNFSMNGDSVVVDFESKKRMKFAIVEFDEGEQIMPFDKVFEEFTECYASNDSQWSEKYQIASDSIETMNSELDVLRQFKTDTEASAASVAREELFAQFEDLSGIEEFENLQNNCAGIEIDILEEKCYAIRGRHNTAVKFSRKPGTPRLRIDRNDPEDVVYGGLFEEYKPTV